MTESIIPQYKLMLFYDVVTTQPDAYYQFVMTEMIPAIQEMGLYFFQVFHTVWGNCPVRQAEFVAADLETIQAMLESEKWRELERKLLVYIANYNRKVVRFRPGFQM